MTRIEGVKTGVQLVFLLLSLAALSAYAGERDLLPMPDSPFKGQIGLRSSESTKDFPEEAKAPEGAPNVLLILTDDVGRGDEHLRRADPDADRRPHRRHGAALQQLPHHGAVLADAGGTADRAQPS